jgi:hypothetical protein
MASLMDPVYQHVSKIHSRKIAFGTKEKKRKEKKTMLDLLKHFLLN